MYTQLVGDKHPSPLVKTRTVYGYIDQKKEDGGTRPERGVRESENNLQVAQKCL